MAGVVHVHAGQCGNQVGEAFWSLAQSTYQGKKDTSLPPLWNDDGDGEEGCSEDDLAMMMMMVTMMMGVDDDDDNSVVLLEDIPFLSLPVMMQ